MEWFRTVSSKKIVLFSFIDRFDKLESNFAETFQTSDVSFSVVFDLLICNEI